MRFLKLLLMALPCLLLLSACGTPSAPADSDSAADPVPDSAPDTSADTTADTEEAPEELPAYQSAFDVPSADGSYTVRFHKPAVVVHGAVGDNGNGHYQFPHLYHTAEGFLLARWQYSADTIKYEQAPAEIVRDRISVNGGKSWMLPTPLDRETVKTPERLMKNGKYFAGFVGKGAHTVSYLDKVEPETSFSHWGKSGYQLYMAEDIAKIGTEEALADTDVFVRIFDPETNRTDAVKCTVNWPHAPLVLHPGALIYPMTQTFAMSSWMIVDGEPYLFMYTYGFDSDADSREDAAAYAHSDRHSVFVFHSPDCGLTWNYLSQIRLDDALRKTAEGDSPDTLDGLCEPKATVLPDGTWLMLLRTGHKNPLLAVRSADKGCTWTRPEVFDECGVLPQLVTLDCGVTLSLYGRPHMFFRFTDDPTGEKWEEHVAFPMSRQTDLKNFYNVSCFNTEMIPLDANRALCIYTDFTYPNRNGEPVRTVLTRIVEVIPAE